jgi:hypothetical protein
MTFEGLRNGLKQARLPKWRDCTRRRRPDRLQPRLDTLEGRALCDGSIALVAGTITIAGSASQNAVVVSYTSPAHNVVEVNWNNLVVDYNRASVASIAFAGVGNSTNLFENLTDIGSTAVGGSGFNCFEGASGHDSFTGGDGFNLFWVAGSNNTLNGGNGVNLFLGTAAGDSIHVGQGLNLIY